MLGVIAVTKKMKYVTTFFILTFAQTWICYFTIILTGSVPFADGLGTILLIFGGMAPSFIGVIMMFATYGKDDRKDFIRRSYQVKLIGIKWWLIILLIFPVMFAVTALITLVTGGDMPAMEGFLAIVQNPVSIILVLFLGFFLNGAFPEELGWRGFALQPLLDRLGFFKANLLLGILWAGWHLPLFFIPDTWHNSQTNVLGLTFYFAQTIGLSMIMCLVFIKTRQSILSAILLHMFYNLSANMMFPYTDSFIYIFFALVFIIGIGISMYIHMSKTSISLQA
jgi:membrane protease YdiL (CAAX protease family)